mgnify:CR=1 FL=1
MTIVKTSDFDRAFNKLPKRIRNLYLKQEKLFKGNWRDSSYVFKLLHLQAIA